MELGPAAAAAGFPAGRIVNLATESYCVTDAWRRARAFKERKSLGAALGLVTGAAVGAGAALLLAPRSGRETRRDIARAARNARRGVEGVVTDFSDTVTGMVETVSREATGVMDRGKHVAAAAKREILKTIDEAQGTFEKQRERLSKIVA